MNGDAPGGLVPAKPDDAGSIARQLGSAYRQAVAFYQKQLNLPPAEADARARGAMPDADPDHDRRLAMEEPADRVHWSTIARIAERDGNAALAAWTRIKRAAADELASGHRAAQALEWGDKPWDRARFLAVRDAFADAWEPKGGVEAALVDVLAQSFSEYLEWAEIATVRAEAEAQVEAASLGRHGSWAPPRVAVADAMTDAATRVERAHRRFLLTLRAMQDLRRPSMAHVVRTDQVVVGVQPVIFAPIVGAGDGALASGADAEG